MSKIRNGNGAAPKAGPENRADLLDANRSRMVTGDRSQLEQHLDYVYEYSCRRWRWECLDCGLYGFRFDSVRVMAGIVREAKKHECDPENVAFMLARFGRHTINNMQ